MEPDFSGWATKNGILCSDGRTIMVGAFKHQDKMKVPLVWQHQHNEPINTIGYAILENRDQGVYTYGYLNNSDYGKHAKELVSHGDITSLSIFANNLSERNKNVMHGDIKEVSLVLSGANPGAYIENVNVVHGDQIDTVVDEAVIYTGLELEHADKTEGKTDVATATDDKTGDKTVKEVFDTLTEEQQNVVFYMIGEALEEAKGGDSTLSQSDLDEDEDTQTGEELLHSALTDDAFVSDLSGKILKHMEDNGMTRNVFEQNATDAPKGATLSHSQLESIIKDAQKDGSLKESFLAHAVEYGIEDIDILFPDAKSLSNSPEVISRRMEWVADVINSTKHSPFSRVKSTAVDLTADEARAKGYVKGNLKKDEIIKLLKRVTTPTTVYKKQKLDRDDIIDITDLDVVAWLKAEMRVMLDEEIARAVLIGDGRESDDEDKIDEDHVRPIAYDADMYATSITIGNTLTSDAIVETIMRSRSSYKGTGQPTFYTTDSLLTDLLLSKDKFGRRLYNTVEELANVLRVSTIIPVEVLEDAQDILGIIVNLTDYTLGADQGGQVSMFDDFDIDYNQYKYLIETRISGALTKPKSAIVLKRVVGTSVTPTSPTYNGTTHVITFPSTTGVDYKVGGVTKTGTLTITETTDVEAYPQAGYSFPHNINRDWTFVY